MYTNSACTSLAAGPYTTNSSGKISITGLTAGTYYVKELGHTDSSINALYTCSSTNPQKVSVTSGGTTSVSFYNKLNTGAISLTKTTEDGKNLSGWRFGSTPILPAPPWFPGRTVQTPAARFPSPVLPPALTM